MVQAGEIIAIIKVIPEMVQLNSAESRVNLANISLKQVEETYKRDTQLFKQGVIAQEDFDLSKANYLKPWRKRIMRKVLGDHPRRYSQELQRGQYDPNP